MIDSRQSKEREGRWRSPHTLLEIVEVESKRTVMWWDVTRRSALMQRRLGKQLREYVTNPLYRVRRRQARERPL